MSMLGRLRPEAGFAGREARSSCGLCATEKEGVHGGTMGSPVFDVRFLDV
jgi:hypothetical protein